MFKSELTSTIKDLSLVFNTLVESRFFQRLLQFRCSHDEFSFQIPFDLAVTPFKCFPETPRALITQI